MISQAIPVASPQTTTPSAAPKDAAEGGDASAFSKLMEAASGQSQSSAQPETPTDAALAEDGQAAPVEVFDTEAAEGLMALLEDVISGLEEGTGPITADGVMKALAERLGEAPAASVGELEAVAQIGDPDLEAAMTEFITASLRSATPLAQLSVASAQIPAVERAQGGPAREAASPQRAVPSTDPLAAAGVSAPQPAAATPAANAATPVQASMAGVPATEALPQATVATGATPPASLAPAANTSALAATGTPQGQAGGAAPLPQGEPVQIVQQTLATPLRGEGGQPLAAQGGQATAEGILSAAAGKMGGDGVDPAALTTAAAAVKQAALGTAPAAMTVAATMAKISAAGSSLGELGPRDAFAVVGPQGQVPLDLSRMAAITQTAAPSPQASPDEQLRTHVAQQIRSLAGNDSSFRFSLSPYGMGEIEIELVRSENGRLQIAMTTESAAVLNVLRQDREMLLDALQSRGISTESADLDFQTFDERGQRGDQHTDGVQMLTGIDAADPEPEPAEVHRPVLGGGRLDILT